MPNVDSNKFKDQWLKPKKGMKEDEGPQTVLSKDMDMSYLKNTSVITGSR